MVTFITNIKSKISTFIFLHRKALILTFIVLGCVFAYLRPQKFTDLWLTRDQQGQILFNLKHYKQAANTFKSTQWQAYSNYGAEQYKNAATLYGQRNNIDSQLAKANALAHGREYIKARNLYQQILSIDPENTAAGTNIKIVQDIIDEVNRLSASQKAEDGEAIKDLGDEPQTGDGAERQEARKETELEQYNAGQLLLDPSLNEMWLRQVQKNPASFLSQKFYLQEQLKNKAAISQSEIDESKNDE